MLISQFYDTSLQHSYNCKLVEQDNEITALSNIWIIEIRSIQIFYVNM